MCGPSSTTISDAFGSGLIVTLYVEDLVNNYWEFDPFVSSNSQCSITGYSLISSSSDITFSLQDTGKYRVTVNQMLTN